MENYSTDYEPFAPFNPVANTEALVSSVPPVSPVTEPLSDDDVIELVTPDQEMQAETAVSGVSQSEGTSVSNSVKSPKAEIENALNRLLEAGKAGNDHDVANAFCNYLESAGLSALLADKAFIKYATDVLLNVLSVILSQIKEKNAAMKAVEEVAKNVEKNYQKEDTLVKEEVAQQEVKEKVISDSMADAQSVDSSSSAIPVEEPISSLPGYEDAYDFGPENVVKNEALKIVSNDDVLFNDTIEYAKAVQNLGINLDTHRNVMDSVKKSPLSASFMKPTFGNAMAAVRGNGKSIDYIDLSRIGVLRNKKVLPFADKLRRAICIQAIKSFPEAISSIPSKYITARMIDIAVKNKPDTILSISNPNATHLYHALTHSKDTEMFSQIVNMFSASGKINKYMCGRAIKQDVNNIKYVPASMLKNKWVIDSVIQKPELLQTPSLQNFVSSSVEVQNKIVAEKPDALLKMSHPDKSTVRIALSKAPVLADKLQKISVTTTTFVKDGPINKSMSSTTNSLDSI